VTTMPPMPLRRAAAGIRNRLRRDLRPVPDEADEHELLELLDVADRRIVERALPYTMTGVARLHALVTAVRYCVRRDVPGALAECGVWRGGSVLAIALTLQELGRTDRDLYLYDTFEGMTEPGEHDVSAFHPPARESWLEAQRRGELAWSEVLGAAEAFGQDAVRELLLATGYPEERVHLVPGTVEETIPAQAPDRLALLRLDTDWYASTRHELEHLYPRLARGGVLIVDDFGHWEGARRAVEEYFAAHPPVLLNRIDYAARIAVKV
jgi:O-methyltransferase